MESYRTHNKKTKKETYRGLIPLFFLGCLWGTIPHRDDGRKTKEIFPSNLFPRISKIFQVVIIH